MWTRSAASLQTVDCWAEEAAALRKLNGEVTKSLEDLKVKATAPLTPFHWKFAAPGGLILRDILSNDVTVLQSAVTGLELGGLSRPHTQIGNQQGSTSQLNSVLARLNKAEANGAKLMAELQVLQAQHGVSSAPAPLETDWRNWSQLEIMRWQSLERSFSKALKIVKLSHANMSPTMSWTHTHATWSP